MFPFGTQLSLVQWMNTIRRILVPTDYSPTSEGALHQAIALAGSLGASIEVLHAWNPEPYLNAPLATDAIAKVTAEAHQEMKDYVNNLHQPEGVEIVGRVHRGLAWESIVTLSHEVDLIVMGTHGRTGMSRILLGSVANRVVQHAACPVMTVRHANEVTTAVEDKVEEKVVHCVFGEDANLPQVFNALKEIGVSVDDVSMVMTEDTHDRDFAALDKTKATTGATAGGFIGGIVGGAVGMGLILTGGAGLVVFGPALALAATGGLLGGIMGGGVPDDKAAVLKAQLTDGKTLLAVHVKDPTKAGKVQEALMATGGEIFDM